MADSKTHVHRGKNPVARIVAGITTSQQKGAQEQLLQDLFEDMYSQRKKLYKMNFVRGIFLGLGTAIGGTLVVALLIWILSFFINAPVIGEFVEDVQSSINQSKSSN